MFSCERVSHILCRIPQVRAMEMEMEMEMEMKVGGELADGP